MAKATIDAGRIMPLHREAYDPDRAYEFNDIVELGGSSYWCIALDAASTRPAPPYAGVWALVSAKGGKGDTGDKGNKGDPGYTPQRGTDYWTDADKAAINSDITTMVQPSIDNANTAADRAIAGAEAAEHVVDDVADAVLNSAAPRLDSVRVGRTVEANAAGGLMRVMASAACTVTQNGGEAVAFAAGEVRVMQAVAGMNTLVASAGMLTVWYNRDAVELEEADRPVASGSGARLAAVGGLLGDRPMDVTLRTVAAQDGVPSPDAPVPIVGADTLRVGRCGRNLFDPRDTRSTTNTVIDADDWLTAAVDNSAGSATAYANWYAYPMAALIPGRAYTLVVEIAESTGSGYYRLQAVNAHASSQFGASTNLENPVPGVYRYTITPDKEYDAAGVQYALRTYLTVYAGASCTLKYRISVLEDAGVQAEGFVYEAYQGARWDVTLASPLWGLPGAEDSVDLAAGVVTRRTAYKVFDGTEAWSRYVVSADAKYQYHLAVDGTLDVTSAAIGARPISRHYGSGYRSERATRDNIVYTNNSPAGIGFAMSGITTIADWKAFLAAQYAAGTPVTVLYELATPMTETILPITIPALDGLNTVYMDADGSVEASGAMSVKGVQEKGAGLEARVAALEAAFAAM